MESYRYQMVLLREEKQAEMINVTTEAWDAKISD